MGINWQLLAIRFRSCCYWSFDLLRESSSHGLNATTAAAISLVDSDVEYWISSMPSEICSWAKMTSMWRCPSDQSYEGHGHGNRPWTNRVGPIKTQTEPRNGWDNLTENLYIWWLKMSRVSGRIFPISQPKTRGGVGDVYCGIGQAHCQLTSVVPRRLTTGWSIPSHKGRLWTYPNCEAVHLIRQYEPSFSQY